jgi:hypothetical protein
LRAIGHYFATIATAKYNAAQRITLILESRVPV